MRLGYQYDFMLNICLAAKSALNVCQSTSELCKSARAIQCILLSAVSKPFKSSKVSIAVGRMSPILCL